MRTRRPAAEPARPALSWRAPLAVSFALMTAWLLLYLFGRRPAPQMNFLPLLLTTTPLLLLPLLLVLGALAYAVFLRARQLGSLAGALVQVIVPVFAYGFIALIALACASSQEGLGIVQIDSARLERHVYRLTAVPNSAGTVYLYECDALGYSCQLIYPDSLEYVTSFNTARLVTDMTARAIILKVDDLSVFSHYEDKP